MTNNWIYIGADISNKEWSKVGKTTRRLNTRHVSTQNTGYFIFTAFNLTSGDVHKIETELLAHLESVEGVRREHHFSTGRKSECFLVNPCEMTWLVESFISERYPSCVAYDGLLEELSRYRCEDSVYRLFDVDSNPSIKRPANLRISVDDYFPGKQCRERSRPGRQLLS